MDRDSLTPGCESCRARHLDRARGGNEASRQLLVATRLKGGYATAMLEMPPTLRRVRGKCKGCGGDLDDLAHGCPICLTRAYARRHANRQREALAEIRRVNL